MPELRNINDQVQVFYDPEGNPSSVMLPFDLFSQLVPQKSDLTTLLKDSENIAKEKNISVEDLLETLEQVRAEMYQEQYA